MYATIAKNGRHTPHSLPDWSESMKRLIPVLLAALLLTACRDSGSSESVPETTSAQTTAAGDDVTGTQPDTTAAHEDSAETISTTSGRRDDAHSDAGSTTTASHRDAPDSTDKQTDAPVKTDAPVQTDVPVQTDAPATLPKDGPIELPLIPIE